MINPIPERTINFNVYDDSSALLGIATVDLPDIEAMTDTVTGAGIAGEVDSPTLGHFGSMTLTINWRVPVGDVTKLQAPKTHHIEMRASQQINDPALGEVLTQSFRVVTRCQPKTLSLGSLEPSAAADTSTEFEVSYIKIFIANVEVLEIDKYNFIFKINGVDYLQNVRRDLGIE